MQECILYDKKFILSISYSEIEKRVREISKELEMAYQYETPVFVVVLNGAFMFASDLIKNYGFNCEVHFIKYSSYEGIQSTGQVNSVIGLTAEIKGKSIIIIEDIVDTGITIQKIYEDLNKQDPKEIKIASMFFKPKAYRGSIKIDYIGMSIPNDFIVGYGLDYDGLGRNYKDVFKLG